MSPVKQKNKKRKNGEDGRNNYKNFKCINNRATISNNVKDTITETLKNFYIYEVIKEIKS